MSAVAIMILPLPGVAVVVQDAVDEALCQEISTTAKLRQILQITSDRGAKLQADLEDCHKEMIRLQGDLDTANTM